MIALLCPGQGGQTRADLTRWPNHPGAQSLLGQWEVVTGVAQDDLADLSDTRLFSGEIAQPLICALSLAHHAVLAPRLPVIRVVAGLSLGELTAHACAGTIAPGDALHLARQRARLMQAASPVPAAMIALRGLSLPAAQALGRAEGFDVAIVHGPDHVVLAGPADQAGALGAAAQARGAGVNRLPIAVAAHTAGMRAAAEAFGRLLAETPMSDPVCPVLSGLNGRPVRSKAAAVAALTAQMWKPLDWDACLTAVAEFRVSAALDIGPGVGLARQMQAGHAAVPARAVQDFADPTAAAVWAGRFQ